MQARLMVTRDGGEVARTGAGLVHAAARAAVTERGTFRLVLAGGSTPRALFASLASNPAFRDLPWDRTQVFWGDERHVGPEHPDSNYRMAVEALLRHVAIAPEQIFRIPAEDADADRAARAYEATVRAACGLAPSEWPRFDLVLLGIGTDGHTASLFPESPVLTERTRLVAAPWVPRLETYRITLTIPVFNHARQVVFVAAGAEKAAPIAAAFMPPAEASPVPAALIHPSAGELTWLLDHAAARLVQAEP